MKDGSFSIRYSIPLKTTTQFKIKSPNGESVDVVIPWLTILNDQAFNSLAAGGKSFYQTFCTASKQTTSLQKREEILERNTKSSDGSTRKSVNKKINFDFTSGNNGDDISSNLVFGGPENGFYRVNEDTGAWIVSEFANSIDGDSISGRTMLSNARKGLKMLEDLGVTYLIIDVSNNGGGVVAYGEELIKVYILFLSFFNV
jgi:hypothetical protein